MNKEYCEGKCVYDSEVINPMCHICGMPQPEKWICASCGKDRTGQACQPCGIGRFEVKSAQPDKAKPKYHIGDAVEYRYYSSDGGGRAVTIIKRINNHPNGWIYNNGKENIFENMIIGVLSSVRESQPDKAKGWEEELEMGFGFESFGSAVMAQDPDKFAEIGKGIKSFIRQAIEEAVKERDEYWHDVLREQREASEDRS